MPHFANVAPPDALTGAVRARARAQRQADTFRHLVFDAAVGYLADEEDCAMAQERKSHRRGFAAMDPKKQREIASKGGRAAHQHGQAHEWTSDEARMAGRKGGSTSRRHEEELAIFS